MTTVIQEVITGITGYNPTETSANAMEYYTACESIEEELEYITDYALNALNMGITEPETKLVWLFISMMEKMDPSEKHIIYNTIGSAIQYN